MKLIAETPQESAILDGLTALLFDLGVEVDYFRHDEVIAVSFFTLDPFAMPDELLLMSESERLAYLRNNEDAIRNAMVAAGYYKLCQTLRHSRRLSYSSHISY